MMDTGWRYRLASISGVVLLSTFAVMLVNNSALQAIAGMIPVLGRLPVDPPTGAEFVIEVGLTVAIVTGAFIPLYKPRPRRILDIIALSHKRLLVAIFALATIGYFDYTYQVPRLTLVLVAPLLAVMIPLWFMWLRRPEIRSERAIIVGNDLTQIGEIAQETELSLLGYLCPTPIITHAGPLSGETQSGKQLTISDGGHPPTDLERLGGLSRLEDILVERDIDTVVLAFTTTDRAEFFGALDACYEHGVAARVHQDHADTVLTAGGEPGQALVDVEIEPWDVQDHVFKRAFDVAFAAVGLVALAPLILLIVVAIKLDDGGPVLYRQERTAVFGETFNIFKFRSMVENAEAISGAKISEEDHDGVDPRVTRVGHVLRQTHLDEIPQLWSVLRGDMSVVGPRPERPELDFEIKTGVTDWHKRWFVKPGLTGPAQVNDVTGAEPDTKLRYDILYVRKQSLSYDLKMVARQIWKVVTDVWKTVLGRDEESKKSE